jgi:hypothetical protein
MANKNTESEAKEVEMVKLSALTTILHNDKEIKPGKKFEIEKEYADRLVKNKAAAYLEEPEEESEEEGAEE